MNYAYSFLSHNSYTKPVLFVMGKFESLLVTSVLNKKLVY